MGLNFAALWGRPRALSPRAKPKPQKAVENNCVLTDWEKVLGCRAKYEALERGMRCVVDLARECVGTRIAG
jgi:hypothetical protein